jgi:crossover junction endodeoxyribonuclease RusA
VKLTLPWPDKRLSPNARVHFRELARVKKSAREESAWETVMQLSPTTRGAIALESERIPMVVTFFPPDRRQRDDDNAIAAFKSLRDGIADALKVDDRRFRPEYHFADPEAPGRVEVAFG